MNRISFREVKETVFDLFKGISVIYCVKEPQIVHLILNFLPRTYVKKSIKFQMISTIVSNVLDN